MHKDARADAVIGDHVAYAMAAGLVPIPLLDIGAVTLVQLDMVRELAELYDARYDAEWGKAWVGSLTGATYARVGASAVKGIPVVGGVLGGAAQAVLSGASTYAVGSVFKAHFQARGGLESMDPERVRGLYRGYLERGRRVARELRGPARRRAVSVSQTADTIERLRAMRDEGTLTSDEFDRLKAAALGRVLGREAIGTTSGDRG